MYKEMPSVSKVSKLWYAVVKAIQGADMEYKAEARKYQNIPTCGA